MEGIYMGVHMGGAHTCGQRLLTEPWIETSESFIRVLVICFTGRP